MSMVDIDKTGDLRINPSLNVDDNNTMRLAHGTLGITLVDTTSNVRSRATLVDGKVEVYNSASSRVARLGLRETDSNGAVDVAKPGSTL